jgi:release factor glutamine methyltransferase
MTATPPSFPSSLSRSALAARLRDAGCVFAEDEADLMLSAARTAEELAAMAERRAAGFPLEHVLGRADFCGLRIVVEPGVFVPRRRTEFLVRRAAALTRPGALVVDLCCGSGALGAALAAVLAQPGQEPCGGVELHAADIDPAAVRCARRNVAAAGGRVHEGDLYDALPPELRGRIEILIANVPYVPTDSLSLLPAEARVHEPQAALDGGGDGLDMLRRVAASAPAWLAPGGHLLVETSEAQVETATAAMEGSGLRVRVDRCDEMGATVLTGTNQGVAQGSTCPR